MYYTYMIRCKDNSIYTGITTDLEKRIQEHITKDEKKCAKYTKRHTAVKLEISWKSENRIYASKLEYWLKHLTKTQKEELIKTPTKLKEFLSEKIEVNKYTVNI